MIRAVPVALVLLLTLSACGMSEREYQRTKYTHAELVDLTHKMHALYEANDCELTFDELRNWRQDTQAEAAALRSERLGTPIGEEQQRTSRAYGEVHSQLVRQDAVATDRDQRVYRSVIGDCAP